MNGQNEGSPAVHNDDDWRHWCDEWSIRADTIYLNHGSFGPPPRRVQECQRSWQQQIASQPMNFFVRHYEPAWLESRKRLAQFVGTSPDNLVFVENSTAAMNAVANSFPMGRRDEVLLTDHEYGAVLRIWQRACESAGAAEPRIATIPGTIESADHIVDAILSAATERTKLLVVSHVTSPTAVILPVKQICDRARERGIAVCVDGPHAPAQIPLALDDLSCDFYTASLHKWVSAPIGSGFLFVAQRCHGLVRTPLLSWGRLAPNKPTTWWDEFIWPGTRDPSACLACVPAIELLEQAGLSAFRARAHYLARYARHNIVELTGLEPQTPDSQEWYGCMASVPLPRGDATGLQHGLWQSHGIEVPIFEHNGQRSVRVSCHLYNSRRDIDSLITALDAKLRQENQ